MRRLFSTLIFGIGVVAAFAAAAKLIFGIAIALPLLPDIPLGRVNAALMIMIALGSFAVAALVGRSRRNETARTSSLMASSLRDHE